MKRFKIAFVCEYDSSKPNVRSGVPYFIAKGFRELGHEVIQIGPFENRRKLVSRIWNAILTAVFNKVLKGKFGVINNQWSREFLLNYSMQTKEQLKKIEYDFVFSPESHTIAYLDIGKPIVFWRDATFENIVDYYPEFSNLHPKSIQEGHRSETEAIKRTSLAIYTSEWAAQSAINNYHANPERVKIIGRGANLTSPPSHVRELIDAKLDKRLKVLFIGANWKRKGGDLAYKAIEHLNAVGYQVELYAIGALPEIPEPWPYWFHYKGYLDKSKPSEYAIIEALYKECHFFVMLSMAENFGIVYAEANAYGLPCIATNTGGVSSAVVSGVNGMLFEPQTDPEFIATYLANTFDNKEKYLSLCLSSLGEYQSRLNWNSNCRKAIEYIEKI